jgi:copper resistance protein D
MIEWLGHVARWLHLASGAIALGALWWLTKQNLFDSQQRRIWRSLPWLLIVFVITGLTLLSRHAALALGTGGFTGDPGEIIQFATQTRFGLVWLARVIVAALLLIYFIANRAASVALSLTIVGLLQAALALVGHGAAADAVILAQAGHAAHVLAASAWLGGLAVLLCLIATANSHNKTSDAASAIRAFSEFALACMIVIVMSGIVIAALQIQRWPGLFGTEYGQYLLLKIALLCVVLGVAGHLRWHAIKTIDARLADPTQRRKVALWLLAELIFALAVMWMAAALAVTPPAQHDQILWPFAFRVAPEITWRDLDLQQQFWWGLAILMTGIAWAWWSRRQFGLRLRDAIVTIAIAGLGLWFAIPALTVPAFPDTYRGSSVPYQSISIANGQQLFVQHCVNCHGVDATGNGPLVKSLAKLPADLTAPHAGDHTPGDMFWWLTHGIANSGMPGFSQLSEDERWDLVNFVHTLASGYQARVIRERVVPMRPWLGAPDFNYVANDGSSGSLKDFREDATVLLVLFGNESRSRLEQLNELRATLKQHRVQIIAVPLQFSLNSPNDGFPVVTEGSDDIVRSYQLLRRTIENARSGEQGTMPQHMEFLIDRFGYVRARWLPEDSELGWRDVRNLIAQIDQLAREPRIKQPPDEHLH